MNDNVRKAREQLFAGDFDGALRTMRISARAILNAQTHCIESAHGTVADRAKAAIDIWSTGRLTDDECVKLVSHFIKFPKPPVYPNPPATSAKTSSRARRGKR